MTTLARLDRVSRRFGEQLALDDVSLEIRSGEILGLLGPNGAGKSTLITLLQGRRRPSSGTVELFGGDPVRPRVRAELGSTPQETALPDTLRVAEVVDLVAAHFADRAPTAQLAEEFGFTDLLRRQCGSLSGGQKRRIAVALAFAGRPRLVLLDEPTTGLDVDARHGLWAAIRRHRADGATVVVTSHYLEEIEALAERVVVIDRGRILVDDGLDAVRARVDSSVVSLRTSSAAAVAALDGVLLAEPGEGERLALTVADSDAFVRALVASALPFERLQVRGASLEEAFLSLTDPSRSALEEMSS
ncbi:ABC transporter ATP-binding protein [Microcella daejeonensis]|uniref:ABC transporter ATP-binding protein n=1 Tax=Microcella daejeonensis TaxID=2994971 RepID=A0A9E8S8I9_9MICO|nr:ABC transporter ATP-binding protein [Microcella daejeonensis]WAB80496.1 ABC transporter ATP-binding protein [Microcella daejeonensis]